MDKMPHQDRYVIVGVDTHADTHVAAVLDLAGRLVAIRAFPATRSGYARLVEWVSSLGIIDRIGIEGTGSWGRGLTLFCLSHGLAVLDVDRPDRRSRRANGKTDEIDAEAAARAVLAGTATTLPKTGQGVVEMIRVLHLTRESAVRSRTQAINQLRSLVVTAPIDLAEQVRGLSRTKLVFWAASTDAATPVQPLRPGWPCARWPDGSRRWMSRSTSWTTSVTGWSNRPHPNCSRSRASVRSPLPRC